MIEYMKPTDSIFESGAEALVCPVNCVGVMGAGLAKEFKRRYPLMFQEYKDWCDTGLMEIGYGEMFCEGLLSNPNFRYIYGFPTKGHWKEKSTLEIISSGLPRLVEFLRDFKYTSIAIPALGCGLGGLEWNDVRPMIEDAFKDLPDVRVMLYPPKKENR